MKNETLYTGCEASLPNSSGFGKNGQCGLWFRCGEGINRVANLLADEFRKLDADEVKIILWLIPRRLSLLVTFKGTGKGKILAEAHLDTVFPKETAAERPFKIDGEWCGDLAVLTVKVVSP